MAIKMDSTDKEILRHLQQDALLTTKELASRLNLSPTPVYERVRRLEKDGVIKKYVALVDREKVAKDLVVFCSIRLKEHAQEAGADIAKYYQIFRNLLSIHQSHIFFDNAIFF